MWVEAQGIGITHYHRVKDLTMRTNPESLFFFHFVQRNKKKKSETILILRICEFISCNLAKRFFAQTKFGEDV